MDITVELQKQHIKMEIGALEDLEYLVQCLNEAWEDVNYSLRSKGKKKCLFIKDPIHEDQRTEAELFVEKGIVYADSPIVHDLIMEEYQSYVKEFGPIPEA